MITVSQKIGRLAEIRMTAPITVEELSSMQRDIGAILNRVSGRLVVCTDLQAATILSTELADRMAKFFRADNARMERNALVVGESPTFFLQVERVIREGNAPPAASGRTESPSSRDPASNKSTRGSDPWMSRRASERRVFRSTTEAMTWLDEVLTPEERARLRHVLEGPHP